MAGRTNSFGTQVTFYCKQCEENLVFLNTHIVSNPVFKCPYCDIDLKVTVVNTKTGAIREKYIPKSEGE